MYLDILEGIGHRSEGVSTVRKYRSFTLAERLPSLSRSPERSEPEQSEGESSVVIC